MNRRDKFHDLLIRNLQLQAETTDYTVDVAFRRIQKGQRPPQGVVSDLGDLRLQRGLKELDATNLRFDAGTPSPDPLTTMNELETLRPIELLRKGITSLSLENDTLDRAVPVGPLMLVPAGNPFKCKVLPETNPCFLLYEGDSPRYAICNAELYCLQSDTDALCSFEAPLNYLTT